MGVPTDSSRRMTQTFIWNYAASCPLLRGQNLFIFVFVAMITQLPRGTPIQNILLAMFLFVVALLLLNYLAWHTLGRLLTTEEERSTLAGRERAKLAWSFWWRPGRKPKA